MKNVARVKSALLSRIRARSGRGGEGAVFPLTIMAAMRRIIYRLRAALLGMRARLILRVHGSCREKQ